METNKIPIIKYNAYKIEDFEQITFMKETKKKIFDRLFICIKQAIKSKKKSIDIFKIENSDKILSLDKGKWKESLTNAINFYSEIEDFEKCIACQELIKAFLN